MADYWTEVAKAIEAKEGVFSRRCLLASMQACPRAHKPGRMTLYDWLEIGYLDRAGVEKHSQDDALVDAGKSLGAVVTSS